MLLPQIIKSITSITPNKSLNIIKLPILVTLIAIIHTNNSLAAAWLVGKNKQQLIIQNWNTRSNIYGNRYGGNDISAHIKASSLSLFLEHGLTNRISIGITSFGGIKQIYDESAQNPNDQKTAIDFTELFTKINILKTDYVALSTQATLAIPGNHNMYNPQNTKPNNAFETRIMLGLGGGNGGLLSGIIGGDGSFINLEVAYRKNQKYLNYNEIRSEIDLGYKINDDTLKMLLIQYFRINKIYKDFNNPLITPQQNGIQYNDINQILVSTLFDAGSNILVQFGLFYEISSKYIGHSKEGNKAQGIILGMWF
ncbi:hypothetical protein [Candidatus Deianiraea vastatrix]|uniref:Outer membrane protein n=1 Tax=Candidatus Deianiraea vastatrix TaxID=2163644 RepID=A0A5B8XJC7_9RICK|nr:hypothetical protein [Candidatus Deianiraea vastatrix]QED23687.1 hypothetical protein Deia_00900 [Candidatus Deianiraea vastatrix]